MLTFFAPGPFVLSLGLPLALDSLMAVVVLLRVGRRPDGVRLGARDGVRGAWLGLVLGVLVLLLGALAIETRAGWSCPSLPGCRPDGFWPFERLTNLEMFFRSAVLASACILGWSGWRAYTSRQPVLVRNVAGVAALAGIGYLVVLGVVTLEGAWDFFPMLHVVFGTLLVITTTALVIVVQRYGQRVPARKKVADEAPTGWRAIVRDYVALTKPRIISLLLLTTLAAMLLATDADHQISFALVAWTMVGGYLAAGGANAINMYLDRDVDALMGRTSRRPLPSSRLEPFHALVFGLVLNALAFLVLALSSNGLAGALALGGSAFYVLIYTRLLKRTTVQNIVIGGAAGAMPPLVGWAAVTGSLNLAAMLLFAIIFYWTPPHFWALALLRRADYARAGIPMLPVARGEAETKIQILLYSFVMVAISVLPAPLRVSGPLYLLLALILGIRFLVVAYKLFREPGTTMAWPLYKYSLLYLALLFGALVVDHLVMLSFT